jgi:aminodeoxyfutalosine synthase
MEMMISGIAERIAGGAAIDESDARLILETPDLITVGATSDSVRRRLHGTRTTFVRVFEVHVDAAPAILPPRVSAGEFRIIGRPASLEGALRAVAAAVAIAGGVPVTGFSIEDLSAWEGAGAVGDVAAALQGAGLHGIAELPVDGRNNQGGAVEAARRAGLDVSRLTIHAMSLSDRIAVVARARDLQNAVGGFRVFAPLPRTIAAAAPSTGYDDVKQIALARLLAANIPSIQVDWALYGPKLAQFALTIGADDVDNVAAVDPGTLGTRRSPLEEIRGNIRSAALEPVERNARFEAIGE